MTSQEYVHGYTEREEQRLVDQATTLTDLLHADTTYPAGSTVLEAGCGVGAQTVILARNSPQALITSVDISEESLAAALVRISAIGQRNVTFQRADVLDLPFAGEVFDHVFICFLLEHLRDPVEVLRRLKRVLKPGGTITAIEGDHGSTYFHPDSAAAHRVIQCLVFIQAEAGGNALIGRQLYPLLTQTGFAEVRVSPRIVYVDGSRPQLIEGFTKNTFIAMVEAVRPQALCRGLIDFTTWDQGIRDLRGAADEGGVFCYTFFKGIGRKQASGRCSGIT
jgi:ubiquinone/menaquinone biosynthesis C-methylase UbiE